MPAEPVKIDSLIVEERDVLLSMPANCDVGVTDTELSRIVPDMKRRNETTILLVIRGFIAWCDLVNGWCLRPAGLRARNNLHRRARRELKGGA